MQRYLWEHRHELQWSGELQHGLKQFLQILLQAEFPALQFSEDRSRKGCDLESRQALRQQDRFPAPSERAEWQRNLPESQFRQSGRF